MAAKEPRALDAVKQIMAYHERSKHHPRRYAPGPGSLDWANEPDPFRRFAHCEPVPLLLPEPDDTPAYERIYEPGTIRPAHLTYRSISRFFECSLALSAWKQYGESRWALRVNPSSGNLHPTEGYLLVGSSVANLRGPGVYHYAAKEHALERRCEMEPAAWTALTAGFPEGTFLVGLSSILWREAWKYGERAFRYCQHDAGHALGALRLAAAMFGWRLVVLEGLGDEHVAGVLGLDRQQDFTGAEREEPELLAAVIPTAGSGEVPRVLVAGAVEGVRAGRWTGRANRLSRRHVRWDAIDAASEASRKPPTDADRCRLGALIRETGESPIGGPTARRIMFQRRSALDFDGRTGLSLEKFLRMLRLLVVCPDSPRPPWDCVGWRPRVDLLLFVHRVESLKPGLYAFVRDPRRVPVLRARTKPEFLWARPENGPDDLSLYLLSEADCRRAASQLSLGQSIAGGGAFSLGMIAWFEESLRENGAWFYRRLFWEAGLIGQVLYLEAEAAGVRATGIGAYFDDAVHETFGLATTEFQSLYHFSVGRPVEDTRLTTLPPYTFARPE